MVQEASFKELSGKREAELPQNQFAAASPWMVWLGATFSVHSGLHHGDGAFQKALGLILSTTGHIPSPPPSHPSPFAVIWFSANLTGFWPLSQIRL